MMWDESQLKVDIEQCIKPRCFRQNQTHSGSGEHCVFKTSVVHKDERWPKLISVCFMFCRAVFQVVLKLSQVGTCCLCTFILMSLFTCTRVYTFIFCYDVINLFGGQQGKCTYWGSGWDRTLANIYPPPAGMKVNWCLWTLFCWSCYCPFFFYCCLLPSLLSCCSPPIHPRRYHWPFHPF